MHPEELPEYFSNILTIISDSGRAIITGKWSDRETLQTEGHSWAHSLRILQATAFVLGGEIRMVDEKEIWLADFWRPLKRGTLQVTKSQ